MSKQEKTLVEKEVVRKQFWELPVLQQKIQIINVVNDYHEGKKYIGDKADKIRFHSYMETFNEMMYNNQYTVSLKDDSMIFLFYEFDDDNNIAGHSLTYLPNFLVDTEQKKERVSDDAEDEEINFKQLHRRISNFVRVDFEEVGNKEYYHSLIHMHIGTERNALRIPIEHCVLPFEFMFFVLKYIYHLPDEELIDLEFEMSRNSMLTENEKRKLKLVFSNCVVLSKD